MATNDDRTLAEKLLEFFNQVTGPYEIVSRIQDDPNFGEASYGITLPVASRILEARDTLPDRRFVSIKQIDDVQGVGPITLHNILFSFITNESTGTTISGLVPPNYDSGWKAIGKGATLLLRHNLGGDVDKYVVDLQFKHIGNREIHQINYGGIIFCDQYGKYHRRGGGWYGLNGKSIKVYLGEEEFGDVYMRVRIWIY